MSSAVFAVILDAVTTSQTEESLNIKAKDVYIGDATLSVHKVVDQKLLSAFTFSESMLAGVASKSAAEIAKKTPRF